MAHSDHCRARATRMRQDSSSTTCDCTKTRGVKDKSGQKIKSQDLPKPSAASNRVCSSRRPRQPPTFFSRPCCPSAITSPGAEDRGAASRRMRRLRTQNQKIVCDRRVVRRRIWPAMRCDCQIHRTGTSNSPKRSRVQTLRSGCFAYLSPFQDAD